jgi:hypothetical protein
MVTRRTLLKGTAAGSIAAIASAHGVVASANSSPPVPSPIPIPYPNVDRAFGAGYGSLEGGALGAFQKVPDGFSVFFKFYKTGGEVFFLEDTALGAVDIFIKFFNKGWDPLTQYGTLERMTLQNAAAGFYKLESNVAGIFLKSENGIASYLDVYADGSVKTGSGGSTCD